LLRSKHKIVFGQRLDQGSRVILITKGQQEPLLFLTATLAVFAADSGQCEAQLEGRLSPWRPSLPARSEMSIPLSNERVILCVDDELTGLTARRLLLSIAGYTVLTATTSEAALELFTASHVDLVITDHLLPDQTGAELASEMKRLKPEVRIVLLTGLVDLPPGYEQADLVLTKGLTPQEFLAEIAALVGQKSASKSTGA
jgi:CheY-like chemotaxis protein